MPGGSHIIVIDWLISKIHVSFILEMPHNKSLCTFHTALS